MVRVCYLCVLLFLIPLFFVSLCKVCYIPGVLDAEMKETITRMGVTLKTKGEENDAVNNEEEELFWFE